MPKAQVNGIETYYEVEGEGQPLLYIHGGFGGPGSTLGLDFLSMGLRGLALPPAKVRTILYHRRCCGRSEYVVEHFTIEDCVEEARALLDHLDIDRSIVLADSAAGPIGVALALAHPDRLTALCLFRTGAGTTAITSGPAVTEESKGLMQDWVRRSRELGDRGAFESVKESLGGPAYWLEPDTDAPAQVRQWMEHARSAYLEALAATSDEELFNYWAGALRTWEAYQGVDYTDRLSELTMPVCIIHGTADDYVPAATALDAHERIPRSELHLVEGADHIGLSMASAAAEALHEWIDRVSGTTARTSARH